MSMEMKETAQANQKAYNIEPNIEAALCYLITPITALFVFLNEKQNKFVRFHAVQAMLFAGVVFVSWNIATISIALIIGVILTPIVSIGAFILWLMLMWKSYNNEKWELPYIGKIANDYVEKNTH